jgi:hypothetical protein
MGWRLLLFLTMGWWLLHCDHLRCLLHPRHLRRWRLLPLLLSLLPLLPLLLLLLPLLLLLLSSLRVCFLL